MAGKRDQQSPERDLHAALEGFNFDMHQLLLPILAWTISRRRQKESPAFAGLRGGGPQSQFLMITLSPQESWNFKPVAGGFRRQSRTIGRIDPERRCADGSFLRCRMFINYFFLLA